MSQKRDSLLESAPAGLIPALKALDKSIDDAYWKCGQVTEVWCYSLLHPGEKLAEVQEHKLAMGQLKAVVGPIVTRICELQMSTGTAPAYFSAMHEMYVAGVTMQAIKVFNDLLEIGRIHKERLAMPHIKWAHDLTLELIKSNENLVKMWVRAVCDPPDHDIDFSAEDPDDLIIGKTWCAPELIVMRPSRGMPFYPEYQWDRTDRETTKQWLKSFAEMFTIRIKLHIDRLADEETVKLAKQPRPAPMAQAQAAETESRREQSESPKSALSIRRENRKLKTQKRNKKILVEFRKLKQRRPNESDVWYSKQLSKSTVAFGLNEETIRKIIRD